ncbi:MAG: cbb3-type cytochrome c oxidase N-terminal domain-containing protein [Bacteroidota bacterium]|nr:cbb3-type cytochrome c oxidase N-terminal domain-containing protein [Bacteroidota bacterium]
MKKKVLPYTIAAIAATIFLQTSLLAQQTTAPTPGTYPTDPGTEIGMIMTVSFLVFVVATLMYIIGVMNTNIDPLINLAVRVKNYVIPQPTEVAHDMGHDFDGIHELDNRIPPWFNYLFGITVLFAVVYLLDYHVFSLSKLSADEYVAEMAAADVQKKILLASGGTIDENTLVALKDEISLNAGKDIFSKYCVSCHGPQGGGIVGPNLTDQYWINGGGIKNVYRTIKKGVPAKGMITWELVFSQKQIQQIASYVLSLQGSNPPGGKSPQGELYVEPVVPMAKDSTKAVVKL